MKQTFALALFLFALGCLVGHGAGCGPSKTPDAIEETAAKYHGELVACNALAKTLVESIECENKVRAKAGRPLRPLPVDGGAK